MNTKEVFTRKRLASVAEAYQALQCACNEVREAFVSAAKDEKNVVYWPLFDLQLLNAIQKVSTPGDARLHATTRKDLRALAFLAYGEVETIGVTEHLPDTEEVIRLALSGQNPAAVGRERRQAQVKADAEGRAKLKAEEEAERVAIANEPKVQKDERMRQSLFESRKNQCYQDLQRSMSK